MTDLPPITDYVAVPEERIQYMLTESELDRIREGSKSMWRELCLVCASLFVPSAINALGEWLGRPTSPTTKSAMNASLFLNSLVAVAALVLTIASGIAWKREAGRADTLYNEIKARPRHQIGTATVSNVGPLSLDEFASREAEKGKARRSGGTARKR